MKGYRIPQLVHFYASHDMIQAHTKLPELASARVGLLCAFMSRSHQAKLGRLPEIVTSLVQLALDTHDTVELASEHGDDRNMRSRQLKVLAGDYFSSRFYHLLAQAGQIDAIYLLSRAVCEVNRMKMTMVDKMKQFKMTAESYMLERTKLKQCVFQAWDTGMRAQDAELWGKALHDLSHLEVVEQEIKKTESHSSFDGSYAYWRILQEGTSEEQALLKDRAWDESIWKELITKYQVQSALESMLEQASKQVGDVLNQCKRQLQLDIEVIENEVPSLST
ncbi:heptaprenyl diphosphate synthase component 1 [Paenibacillus aquistagni]|uniref:heptaprenyl diphosphate synthase component 1 n=1 Tax=Paenibacillus aquistagni TaxID=1852522 RepID=UPI000B501489|nr:heptaprenyl diphosphate synthase component 1 [Paenibacillus aquistagni]